MDIDQSRAMSATFPSKRTGDVSGAVVMRTACPRRALGALGAHQAGSSDHATERRIQLAAKVPCVQRQLRLNVIFRCVREHTVSGTTAGYASV